MTKSYLAIYWTLWFLIVSCLLSVRHVFGVDQKAISSFSLFSFYMVPTWITIMILNFFEGHRLMGYLKMNHFEKWEELTHVPFFGSGGVNSFRSLPFLFSKDHLSDPVVKELKTNYKKFLILMLTVFVTIPILFFLV